MIAGELVMVMFTPAKGPVLVQFASLTLFTPRIVEALALTLRENVDEVIPLWSIPSDQWTVHGLVPVRLNATLTTDGPQAERVDGSEIAGRALKTTVVDAWALPPHGPGLLTVTT